MVGADWFGRRVEKPRKPHKDKYLPYTGKHIERLMIRDVAMATLRNNHGWTITQLCLAFKLSRWQVVRVLDSIEEAERLVLR